MLKDDELMGITCSRKVKGGGSPFTLKYVKDMKSDHNVLADGIEENDKSGTH